MYMNCENSEQYFMLYMDNILSGEQAQEMNSHLKECDKCTEEFLLYDNIMSEFSKECIVEAKDNFEAVVMEKIKELNHTFNKAENRMDSFAYFVWGSVSVIFGLGFLLAFYREQIISGLATHEVFSPFIVVLEPIANFASSILLSIMSDVGNSVTLSSALFTEFRFYLIGSLIVIGLISLVRNRKPVKAKEAAKKPDEFKRK